MTLTYKKRFKYKYKLSDNFECDIYSKVTLHNSRYINISKDILTVKKGYCWDGASGPTIDTKTVMKASLVHDVLYQLMRERVLPQSSRMASDNIFREICLEQGMSRFRAWYLYTGLRIFGAKAAKPNTLIIR